MEEIEVLDLESDNKVIKQTPKARKSKDKKKKKLRKCEKLFILINVLIIFGIIGYYAYRTVHYYKLSHEVVENITLKEKVAAFDKLTFQNDGLYENNGYYYFKGNDVDNYVYYSGRMFRIIDIDKDNVRLIEDDSNTNLVWGVDTNFSDSIVNNWLKKYVETLKDYEVYLEESNWCNDKIKLDNYECKELINGYVGLLSTKDYLQAGGKNSYLNNKTYFWTINQDGDGKTFYVNDEGSINNISSNDNNYYSYGVRPVITLKSDVMYISGAGTLDEPYIIEEEIGFAILKDNSVGSYVLYNNQKFRILKIEDDGVLLILDGVLDINKGYKDAIKYLNNDYLKTFNKDDLVKINYGVSEYNYENKYNYLVDKKSESNYCVMPQIGDMFLNDYANYWLMNISDSKLGLYYTLDENKFFFGDLTGNSHPIRPIIKLKGDIVVESGKGSIDEPLLIGETNEENVE